MTTNDDLLRVLNSLKIQADENTANLRKDVNLRIDEIAKKVDNVKNEAIEKEKRDEQKLSEVHKRLEQIETNMINNKDKCAERERLAAEQKDRTDAFKNAVGLKIQENPAPQSAAVTKPTWSELRS